MIRSIYFSDVIFYKMMKECKRQGVTINYFVNDVIKEKLKERRR